MKKKSFLIAAMLVVLLVVLPVLTACNKDDAVEGHTLVIYNWEDYIEPSLLDEFAAYYETMTGHPLTITYTTFDTNETMMTKVQKNDANVDLICPSDYAIEKLMLGGYLKNQINLAASLTDTYGITFENLGNVERFITDAIDSNFSGLVGKNGKSYDMNDYMIPYMWGTLGILYNKAVVSIEELEQFGWGVLWNEGENEELYGNILVKDSIRDTYAAAVLYMRDYGKLPDGISSIGGKKFTELTTGELMNCTDDALLSAAEKILIAQRSIIAGYEVDFGKDDMLNEIVYADLAWSGDALWAVEESWDDDAEDYYLGYYIPSSGTNVWYDGWVIPNTAKNDLAAMMFIDYMCDPVNAIWNSMAIGYTCGVAKQLLIDSPEVAEVLIECEYDIEEYFADEGRYPDITEENIGTQYGLMRDFGKANDKVVQMWERAKAGNDVPWVLIWCLVGMIGAAGLTVGAFFLKDYLKRRPRKLTEEQSPEQLKTN